jgi:hypothetical protein
LDSRLEARERAAEKRRKILQFFEDHPDLVEEYTKFPRLIKKKASRLKELIDQKEKTEDSNSNS